MKLRRSRHWPPAVPVERPKENKELWKDRLLKWRREPVTVKLEHPTRIDRARSLGFKAKKGVFITTSTFSVGAINYAKNVENKIILIAEDFEVNYLLIKEILNKFQVQSLWAENGKHAVEICEKNNDINAVLMDIKMPVMNGIEATKQIRKFRKDLPIIAQTAYVQTEEINKILNAGCNDYISKPINALELISTVGKHL